MVQDPIAVHVLVWVAVSGEVQWLKALQGGREYGYSEVCTMTWSLAADGYTAVGFRTALVGKHLICP